ncbi:hypothetical protein [Deinococcus ruber]|uniref:hypothetical protein n=1 Tax=Deinococcus ruber TaxID=1848197 RepID=UPI001666F4C8|nr:hypothetical protein [Deinococcus ruber]
MSLPPHATAAPVVHRPYTPPRLIPLGAWRAVTLIISVPIGPGSRGVFNPTGPSDGGN